jgi:hypothetical protein
MPGIHEEPGPLHVSTVNTQGGAFLQVHRATFSQHSNVKWRLGIILHLQSQASHPNMPHFPTNWKKKPMINNMLTAL